MLIVVVHENAIGSKVQCPQIVYRNMELFLVLPCCAHWFYSIYSWSKTRKQTDQTRFDTLSSPITHSVLWTTISSISHLPMFSSLRLWFPVYDMIL